MTSPPAVVTAEGLHHYFGHGSLKRPVLRGVNLEIRPREIVILTGPSGSGKTTLLSLLGGLRAVQEGSLRILGQEVRRASRRELGRLRRRIGYIFQHHNLIDSLSALRNVGMGLPARNGISRGEAWRRCGDLLEEVGLSGHKDSLPSRMSGGQKQRVAVARALVGRPRLVLADEPTASLDAKSGREVAELLQRLAQREGSAVVLVTHDNRIFDFADRMIHMEDGQLVSLTSAVSSSTRQLLLGLTRSNRSGELTRNVGAMGVESFTQLLDSVTNDFEQFRSMSETANDTAFESMLDQVIEAFTLKAGQILRADRATLFLRDDATGELWAKVAQGEGAASVEIRIPAGSGIAGHVVATGETLNVASAHDHPLFNADVDRRTGYRTASLLCVPIAARDGSILGAVQALNKAGGTAFDTADESQLRTFAASLSVILEAWRRMRARAHDLPRRGS